MKPALLFFGLLGAALSAAASAILMCSFASTALDYAMAAGFAIVLVACQFLLFVGAISARGMMRSVQGVAVVFLFVASTAATVGWWESRFNAAVAATPANVITEANANRLRTLQQITASMANSATADAGGRYNGRSITTAADARALDQRQAELITEMQHAQQNAATTTAGGALGVAMGKWRWALWVMLAALTDLCPMLCLAAALAPTSNVTERCATPETQPEQQETPEETNSATHHIDSLAEAVEAEIKRGQYGDKPSVRGVMERHNIRYDRASAIFNQLQQVGVITRNGNRYHMTGVV